MSEVRYKLRPLALNWWEPQEGWSYLDEILFAFDGALRDIGMRCPGGIRIDDPWGKPGRYSSAEQGRTCAVEDLSAVGYQHFIHRDDVGLDNLITKLLNFIA